MRPTDLIRSGYWLALGWLLALILFRRLPGLDLAVTGMFYTPGVGFPWAGNALQEALRQGIWNAAIVVFVVAGGGLLWTWRGRVLAGLGAAGWGLIFWLFLLGPGLLVNGWLKRFSGRARPAQVTEFGGDLFFTRAGDFADQCRANCSFVSGEVSATTALAVAVWGLTGRLTGRWGWLRRGLRGGALLGLGFVMAQRVATGRHFLSDAVFAVLVTLSLAWGLSLLLRLRARLRGRPTR